MRPVALSIMSNLAVNEFDMLAIKYVNLMKFGSVILGEIKLL